MFIYIYIYIYCMIVYIYIYIYVCVCVCVCVCMYDLQCNPDIRELSGQDIKSLISVFLLYPSLVYFA